MTAVASDGIGSRAVPPSAGRERGTGLASRLRREGRRKWEAAAQARPACGDPVGPAPGPAAGLGRELADLFLHQWRRDGTARRSGLRHPGLGGHPEPDGFVISDKSHAFVVRLHLAGKTGKLLAIALRDGGALAPWAATRRTGCSRVEGGGVIYDPGRHRSIFPEGGQGRVMWGAEPIRWQGAAVVDGFDFAWWLPPLK